MSNPADNRTRRAYYQALGLTDDELAETIATTLDATLRAACEAEVADRVSAHPRRTA